jgi:hypothetical protein
MVAAHKRLLKGLPAPEDFHQNHKSARNAQQATVTKMTRPVCERPPGASPENDDSSTYLYKSTNRRCLESGRNLPERENWMEGHWRNAGTFERGGG